MKSILKRFHDKWEYGPMKYNNDRCWEWTASLDSNGYGKLGVNGQWKLAHRVSWELFNGTILNDLQVLHKCNNRRCVNPDHLYLGTNADNMKDKAKAGTCKGERHWLSKLTTENVKNIRELYATGIFLQSSLAKVYGVTCQHISAIITNKRWEEEL